MAWISIHQQIRGAKLRQFYKSIKCSEAEAIGILTMLWLWGIDNTTEDGEIKNADADDLAAVISISISKPLDAYDIINALVTTCWIDLKDDTFYFHDWDEWQEKFYKGKRERGRKTEWQRQQRRHKDDPVDVHEDVHEDVHKDVHKDVHETRSQSQSQSQSQST